LCHLVLFYQVALGISGCHIKKIRIKIDPGIVIPLFYCVSGIILTIILEFDGELTKMQRSIVILVFIFIATISIGVVMLVRKIKALNVARHNCT
jgi:hypothetical protein